MTKEEKKEFEKLQKENTELSEKLSMHSRDTWVKLAALAAGSLIILFAIIYKVNAGRVELGGEKFNLNMNELYFVGVFMMAFPYLAAIGRAIAGRRK